MSKTKEEALYSFIFGDEFDEEEYETLEEAIEGEIQETGTDNEFSADGGDYLVLTDSEADDEAKESLQNLIDDIGLEAFNKSTVISYIEDSEFVDVLGEYRESYYQDIASEESSDDEEFVNRLHEELVEEGIMENTLTNSEESKEELETEAEDNIDEAVEKYKEDMKGEGFETYSDELGGEEAFKLAVTQGWIDMDGLIEEIVNIDGRGHTLSGYDGAEEEGEGDNYIYRTN